jgi:hypothetical protein
MKRDGKKPPQPPERVLPLVSIRAEPIAVGNEVSTGSGSDRAFTPQA